MAYQELFSPAKIALNREVQKHPVLIQMLAAYGRDDWGGIIGEIAAYCNIAMEGEYTEAELERLYEVLVRELAERSRYLDKVGLFPAAPGNH